MAPAGAGFAAALEVLARARERLKVLASLSPEPGMVRYVGGLAFDPRHGANPDWPAARRRVSCFRGCCCGRRADAPR